MIRELTNNDITHVTGSMSGIGGYIGSAVAATIGGFALAGVVTGIFHGGFAANVPQN